MSGTQLTQRLPIRREKTILLPTEPSVSARDKYLEQLTAYYEQKLDLLKVDCSPLEQVFSWHIHVLWQTRLRCSRYGSEMKLENAPEGLARILNMLDLAELFGCARTQATQEQKLAAAVAPSPAEAYFEQEFPPTENGVAEAEVDFITYLKKLPIPALTQFELLTAFYEIATNIATHGQIEHETPIRCMAFCGEGIITLTFNDGGVQFDPTARQTAGTSAARSRQTHGYGLSLIRKLTDRMRYTRTGDNRNELTIEKYWGAGDLNNGSLYCRALSKTALLIRAGRRLDNGNSMEMVSLLNEGFKRGYTSIVLDMQELEFISSAGVGSILSTIEQFRSAEGDIILCNVSANTKHVLTALDLIDYLTITPNQHDAAAACGIR